MKEEEIREKNENIIFLYDLFKETGDEFYRDVYFYGLEVLIGQKISDRLTETLDNLISEFAEYKPIESFQPKFELEKTLLQNYYDKLQSQEMIGIKN